jgi:hypothetical protein
LANNLDFIITPPKFVIGSAPVLLQRNSGNSSIAAIRQVIQKSDWSFKTNGCLKFLPNHLATEEDQSSSTFRGKSLEILIDHKQVEPRRHVPNLAK